MTAYQRIIASDWRKVAVVALLMAVAVAVSAGTVLAQGRSTDRPHDHIGNFNFKVEIEGVTQGAFTLVSGIESEVEVVEYRDGDDMVLRKRPGRTKYSNITLKRGYTASPELWNWFRTVVDGRVERKAGSIILLGPNGEEIERYNFFEAWPVRYRNYELGGADSDTVIEEIEIAVEKIERG
ncbi:MAG: phage tail protein [Dehalococcoidia bacterium]